MAMATKAKLLSRELKEAKAALMIAKQRCAQLEEENKTIREGFCNGLKLDDEDLVLYILLPPFLNRPQQSHNSSSLSFVAMSKLKLRFFLMTIIYKKTSNSLI